jgi:hypothetical protein
MRLGAIRDLWKASKNEEEVVPPNALAKNAALEAENAAKDQQINQLKQAMDSQNARLEKLEKAIQSKRR